MSKLTETPKLLLEIEAAEILGYSCSKLKRLRLSGRLEYIPGRPVLITEQAIQDYLDQKQSDKEKLEKLRTRELSPKAWAMMAVLFPRAPRTPKG